MAALEKGAPVYKKPDLEVHKGGKGEHPRRPFRRLLAAAAVVATLVVGGRFAAGTIPSGSSEPSRTPGATKSLEPSQIPSQSIPIKDTPPPTPTATVEPSPTEKPTPAIQNGFSEQDGNLIYKTKSGEIIPFSQIPGLKIVLNTTTNTYEYRALADNPYKLPAEALGAVPNPDVSVEGKQVGGFALAAPVAEWYLQHTADVDGIPPILSPVDLRTATGVSMSSGTFVDGLGNTDTNIEVTTAGTATLTDILPGTRTIAVQKNPLFGTAVYDPSSQSTAGGDKWSYLMFTDSGIAPLAEPATFSLGQEMGKTTGITVRITSLFNQVTNINASAMLRIGNSPVSAFQ